MIIDALAVDVVKLDEVSVSDGEGGFITEYREGAPFTATITPDASLTSAIKATKVAQKESETKRYKVSTPINAKLRQGDIIKRLEDGILFRIIMTSDETAKISTLRFNLAKAEEWEMPRE